MFSAPRIRKLNIVLPTCLAGIVGVVASAASAEDRYGVEPPGRGNFNFGSLIVLILVLGGGYLVVDIAFRSLNGRAPSSEERIIWTIILVFGGALILGVLRKW